MPSGRVRFYIACSLDGFVAGPADDLSWLPGSDGSALPTSGPAPVDSGALEYEAFMADVGAVLMGRNTYDVVAAFEPKSEPLHYSAPVLVATSRSLDDARVRAVSGAVSEVVAAAREVAGERDVYLDGARLIRSALDARLVDELVLTVVPIVLGEGVPLFAGAKRKCLEFTGVCRYKAGMIQIHAIPAT